LRKASLSQWRSLLAQCEREAFIILRLLATVYHQGSWFFPRYIIRHIARHRKKQGSGIYGEAAIMSERPLKLSCPTVYLYSKCVYIACYQLCRFYLPWYLFRSVCFQQCRCLSGKYISVYLFMCPSV
jgi:hypothetical protein